MKYRVDNYLRGGCAHFHIRMNFIFVRDELILIVECFDKPNFRLIIYLSTNDLICSSRIFTDSVLVNLMLQVSLENYKLWRSSEARLANVEFWSLLKNTLVSAQDYLDAYGQAPLFQRISDWDLVLELGTIGVCPWVNICLSIGKWEAQPNF